MDELMELVEILAKPATQNEKQPGGTLLSLPQGAAIPGNDSKPESPGDTLADKPTSVAISPLGGPAAPLANAKPPYYQNQRERYTHRIMLEKAAQGYNIKEIAEQTGYTTVAVNNILRQPHAQQTLVDEIRRIHGVDEEVVEIIKRNVVKSAKLYETILNDPNADRKDRMEAAERFFNRRYGKPTQPMSQGTCIDLNDLSDDELAKMLPTASTGTSH